jgi:hypothetical protein
MEKDQHQEDAECARVEYGDRAEEQPQAAEEATEMLHRSNYNLLVSRGRKAGLTARELNSALSSRPPLGEETQPGQPDCNGFVWDINEQGQRVYRLAQGPSAS